MPSENESLTRRGVRKKKQKKKFRTEQPKAGRHRVAVGRHRIQGRANAEAGRGGSRLRAHVAESNADQEVEDHQAAGNRRV